MNKLSPVDLVALVLVIVGGINWGLVALANMDLVALIFGDMTMMAKVVYALVGVSAVYTAVILMKLRKA